jgi:hypothetical protein
MKLILALFTIVAALNSFAADHSFYGSWFNTRVPSGGTKTGGEFTATIHDFPNAASTGLVEIHVKAKTGASTYTTFNFSGLWTSKTAAGATFVLESSTVPRTTFRGTFNAASGGIKGTFVNEGSDAGKFLAAE